MATIWKGAISFGLVNIPVQLRTAVRSDRVSFRMLHAEDHTPIHYRKVTGPDDEPVSSEDLVKGFEVRKGKYVVLTDEDFDKARLESSSTFDICDFVNEAEIDTRFWEKPYYLIPEPNGAKPYALLREAIRKKGMVGIGRITIRTKQHLAAIRTVGDALVLELMRFAHELVDASEYRFPDEKVQKKELDMAVQLIDGLSASFDPEKYTDTYRDNLMRIIKARAEGEEIDLEEPASAEDTGVIDLMSRLRESLDQTDGSGGKAKKGKKKGDGRKKKSA